MKKFILLQVAILVILFSMDFAWAGYRDTFEKEFMLSPWSITKGETSACIQCHSSATMGPEMHQIVRQWKDSWHAKNNISCHDCHGGAPEDASMSMMHQRGFLGSPESGDIPEFCGKCHIAILNNYQKSGHGKMFYDAGEGPSCVNCHGAHDIGRASMDIINEQLCSECHTYDRAKEMKEALFLVEDKLSSVDKNLDRLKILGFSMEKQEKSFFRTHAEFRALFHSIDVEAVHLKSGDFTRKLAIIKDEIDSSFKNLSFRRNFSAYLLLLFIGLSIAVFLIAKSYKQN